MDKQLELVTKLKKDPIFIASVEKSIAGIRANRKVRKPLPKGLHYKRDWYNRMVDAKIFNTDYFINEIEAIWNKKSQLSNDFRHIIKTVCDIAYYETVKYYGELEEKQESVID